MHILQKWMYSQYFPGPSHLARQDPWSVRQQKEWSGQFQSISVVYIYIIYYDIIIVYISL